MTIRSIVRLFGVAAVTMLGASCGSDSTAPAEQIKTTSELRFLHLASGAPGIRDTTVSFWAKRGADREVRIRYAVTPGSTQTEEFVRFRVRPEALERYPDGRAFAADDSVLITLHIVDFSRLIVDFQPSGLRFSAGRPAELKFKYVHASHDLDGDGDVDAADASLESSLAIWRQEAADQPWFRMSSQIELELDEINADITGFSGYAIAY